MNPKEEPMVAYYDDPAHFADLMNGWIYRGTKQLMAEQENSKDLISVLWSGADVLRSKMDANEYKNYLLGIVFYKYLSDSFLIRVYDLINDEKPKSLKVALEAYKNELKGEYANDLLDELKQDRKYVIEPELTYTCFAEDARNNCFNREQLQKAFNNIEQSGELFVDLFSDIDLYSSRLGAGDQKQSDTIAELIKVIDQADLLNSDGEILGDAYEYLIGQFASETGKKAGEFYTPQAVSKILTRIAITGQENVKGLSIYDPCMGSGSLLLNAKRYYKGDTNYIKYYGQELNMSTYNLARMKEVDKDSPEYQTSSEKFRKQTENGYAYYIDLSKNYSLVRLNTSNKTLELLYGEKGNKVVNYNVYGNKIFFQVESTDGMTGLYRMNIDGTQIETIAIGNITNIHCTSKYTFFQYYEDQGVLYRVSTSGADTSVEQITIK